MRENIFYRVRVSKIVSIGNLTMKYNDLTEIQLKVIYRMGKGLTCVVINSHFILIRIKEWYTVYYSYSISQKQVG